MAATLARDPRSTDAAHPTDRAASHPAEIPGPPLAHVLFKDTRAAWLWLPLRLYLG